MPLTKEDLTSRRKWEFMRLRDPYTNTIVAVTSQGDVYAALSNGKSQGIWHSTDGINWTDITPTIFPAVYGRIVIASAPTNANVLYVLANTPGSGVYSTQYSITGIQEVKNIPQTYSLL